MNLFLHKLEHIIYENSIYYDWKEGPWLKEILTKTVEELYDPNQTHRLIKLEIKIEKMTRAMMMKSDDPLTTDVMLFEDQLRKKGKPMIIGRQLLKPYVGFQNKQVSRTKV